MGKVVQFTNLIKDGIASMVGNMGHAGRDKAASTGYIATFMDERQLSASYRSSWIARKLVTIPAHDAFRRWRDWQGDKEQIGAIEAEEQRLGLAQKLRQTMVYARLFGGAALYISTGDTDPSQPLEVERIGKGGIKFVNIMRPRDLRAGPVVQDPESEWYGKPEYWDLSLNGTVIGTRQFQTRIHPSRLVFFMGAELPDDIMEHAPIGQGWGDSILTATINEIKRTDSTSANIASLVFEAKVDIVKVPNLMNQIADPQYESRMLQRLSLANMAKGINGMLIIDSEEDYEQKSASFAQLPDVLFAFMQLVCGAADIPVTRFMNQSPAGMNSTGESDLRNYYDHVQSEQRNKIDPAIYILNECLIRSALGTRPPELFYTWASLWQVSDKERAEIGKMNTEIIKGLHDTGLFPPEALAKSAVNMLVEASIMPGLEAEIEDAGGHIDFEAQAEEEAALERERIEAANQNNQIGPRAARTGTTNDMAPQSLYVSRKVVNAAEIKAWAKSQGIESVQDDLHVTIIHTRTQVDWMKMGTDEWSDDDEGRMVVKPGGPRAIEQFGEAVVLSFVKDRLRWRHENIKERGDAVVDYPDYQPHITLTWKTLDEVALAAIKPYTGKIVLGPEIFETVDDDWRSSIKES